MENPILIQISLILKDIRTKRLIKDISQYEMADSLNISQNSYFKLEKGKTKLDVYRLIQISNILELNLSDLFKVYEDSSNNI
ncbi:MAG: helix-turn-helix transcriptional regulator [Polaribacter sp.]|uniref:helix-turn-helix domain-containing protein n=1 Tax=Polaribacter sp. TaxID=1920175 RepID=UPI002F3587E1